MMLGCFAKVAFFIIDFWSQSNRTRKSVDLRCGEEADKSCVRQTFHSVDSTYIISPEALMRVPGPAAALQNKSLLARVFSPDLLKISEGLRRPSTKAQLSSGPHHVIQKQQHHTRYNARSFERSLTLPRFGSLFLYAIIIRIDKKLKCGEKTVRRALNKLHANGVISKRFALLGYSGVAA
jgi:hypothetical protein